MIGLASHLRIRVITWKIKQKAIVQILCRNISSEKYDIRRKKNLQKMGLGKKKVFSSYSWPLHTAHGLKERWHLAPHALRRLATVLGGLLEFNSHNISADFDGDRWGHATPSGFLPPCQWHLLTPIPPASYILFVVCSAILHHSDLLLIFPFGK